MPLTRPFNEECLWKSTMERSGNNRPLLNIHCNEMVLPKINSIVGGTIADGNDIHGDRVKRNAHNSAIYWAEVNERKASYREKYKYPLEEEHYFSEQFQSTLGLEKGRYIFRRLWRY